ncbi:MAG TPA: cyclic nucleotide-binding domain-containing protein [Methylomirabilota bacterium]|jgi:CRP-like cAMP-binding protein|nr:cyclic nucleotide-binding domain-containing protein [Methylomirabilota bacterium]
MEFIGRVLDGSFGWDLRDLLRKGEESARLPQDEKIRHLQKVDIFADCTRKQLKAVAAISRVVEVPTGTMLTRVGEPGEEFFFILDGAAMVDVTRRKRIRLGPGEFFGEMSLLDGEPRSATVRAETDMRLLVILRRNFQSLLTEVPELTRSILVVLSRRLREIERALNA